MNKTTLPIFILLLAIAQAATAGAVYVGPGPVNGKWESGDSVIVRAGSYVEAGGMLEVEQGVQIFFESVGRFEVSGVLAMSGSREEPIVVYCAEGWRGFRLRGAPAWHTLNFVHIVADRGLARRGVEVDGSSLEMNSCKIIASENCLRFDGSQLHARMNHMHTSRLYSKVVELLGMEGFASEDCGAEPGNIFRDNYLQAEINGVQPGDLIDPYEATAGLWVDYCTNICLSFNDITVRAPLSVVGVRLGNVPSFGDQSWDITHSTVYAESRTLSAIGILNEVSGDLDISKLTITVRGTEGFASSCFFASRTSYIRINSTTTVMGSPRDIYYNTSGAGRIDANYTIKWSLDAETLDESSRPGGADGTWVEGDEQPRMINIGDSVWDVDPIFAAVGEWGEWRNAEEIAAFFSLRSNSPCIDRGDPERGLDPDATRLDIGRFFYDQATSGVDDPAPIVSASALGAAYPNPFNPSTTLPIQVANPGLLRVTVWDVLGRVVYETARPVYQAGLQNVHFQASNLASGLYLAQAEMDGQMLGHQKLMLVK